MAGAIAGAFVVFGAVRFAGQLLLLSRSRGAAWYARRGECAYIVLSFVAKAELGFVVLARGLGGDGTSAMKCWGSNEFLLLQVFFCCYKNSVSKREMSTRRVGPVHSRKNKL